MTWKYESKKPDTQMIRIREKTWITLSAIDAIYVDDDFYRPRLMLQVGNKRFDVEHKYASKLLTALGTDDLEIKTVE